jgi:predicted benzoate:H+ symporter BenE
LFGHVLRNAMIPVLTFMGLQFANLLAGAVVVENVFFLPGLGRLLFQSVANRDLIVVRNGVLVLAALVIGTLLSGLMGLLDFSGFHLEVATPVWTTPHFSLAATISIGIPLFVVAMTSQRMATARKR